MASRQNRSSFQQDQQQESTENYHGCKWSLKQLRFYLEQNKYDDWLMWQRIATVIVLTIISQLAGIPNSSNCFEFYGFDILIDSLLKPWLLEVNLSPALCTDCDVDPAVKKPMLHDLFDLLGLPVCNTGLSLFSNWSNCVRFNEVGDYGDYPRLSHNTSVAVNVVSLATKWKRQLRQSSPNTQKSPKKFTRKRDNLRLKSAGVQKKPPGSPPDALDSSKTSSEHPKCKWDNGRDWRNPPNSEGDWVRIFPFYNQGTDSWDNDPITIFGDEQIRHIVSKVSKFYKVARDVFNKTEKFSDDERDDILLNNSGLADVVWHPYK